VLPKIDPTSDAIIIGAPEENPKDHLGAETPVTDEASAKDPTAVVAKSKRSSKKKQRPPPTVVHIVHVDIIKDDFWTARPEILD
ncbi:hypothetical protein FRC09_000491, partial [Ceratobasidium sp. 395]